MEAFLFVEQAWWEWIIAGYLFLGGLAGLAMAVAYYYWYKEGNKFIAGSGSVIAFASIVIGLLLLIIDLGRPKNVMALFTSPRLNLTSWMTIGTYIISAFTVVTGIFTLPFLPVVGARFTVALRRATIYLGALAAILGLATAAYTGFLLAAARGVQFWNTPLLPVLFLASALSSGLCVYCAIAAPILLWKAPGFREGAARVRLQLQRLDLYTMVFELFLIFALLAIALEGPPGAAESASRLVSGDLAGLFWAGAVFLGLLVPIFILYFYTLRKPGEDRNVVIASMIAGWLVLIGALILRYTILAAGVIPAPLS